MNLNPSRSIFKMMFNPREISNVKFEKETNRIFLFKIFTVPNFVPRYLPSSDDQPAIKESL